MSEKEVNPEPEPETIPETPCASCVGTGMIHVDWDEDGNDILDICITCSGE